MARHYGRPLADITPAEFEALEQRHEDRALARFLRDEVDGDEEEE